MNIATFFISKRRRIFTKLLAVSERSINMKNELHGTLFVILLASAVICKQRLFRGNEIVQYLQNCKCYNVCQDHLRKTSESSIKFAKIFERPVQF